MERSMVAGEGGSRTRTVRCPVPVLPSTCPHRRRRWMSSTDRQLQENGRTVTRSYWLFLKQGQINLKQGLIHLKPDNLSLALWTMDNHHW